MITGKAAVRFENPVMEKDGLFTSYWQRSLSGIFNLLNALIASRNTGVTGAILTGATIAHGLSKAPSFVVLAPKDGTPTNYFVDNITATTFRVNFAGGGTHAFGWIAET